MELILLIRKIVFLLIRSTIREDLLIFKVLLAHDSKFITEVKSNYDQSTLLHYAVKLDDIKAVSLLIEKGADVNALDKEGMTPLSYLQNENIEIAKLLLEKGANPNIKNDEE